MTDADPEALPDWRDTSGGGLVRGALWLCQEVGEGNIFTKSQLRAAFPDLAQIDRRVRDLRDYGWVIDTSREDATLGQAEQRFVKQGVKVWDPQQRKKRAALSGATRHPTVAQRATDAALDVEELADRAATLPTRERTRLLAWITMGERPRTPVEELWDQYVQLPTIGKQQLALHLARLLGQDAQAEDDDTSAS
ncbi:hypothetical protein [Streptomyces swartbergensis]|uniref:hypothetical protein n=1 Tax=Streptomyces swartbergensis TaxID=487165 RepID=UPI003830519D